MDAAADSWAWGLRAWWWSWPKRWLPAAIRKATRYSLSGHRAHPATAEAARAKGIDTIEQFFGVALAKELEQADLVVANNVLAHVPDINDFVAGIARLLKPKGVPPSSFRICCGSWRAISLTLSTMSTTAI